MNDDELSRTVHSPIIPRHIVTLTQKAAHNNVPVLIKGELGTGKELIAKIIHHTGDWKDHPFYKIDCRILTEDAFSAQLSRLFKEFNDGTTPATLYLKEVGYLGQENQLKLLELIEDGIFQNGIERKDLQKPQVHLILLGGFERESGTGKVFRGFILPIKYPVDPHSTSQRPG